MKRNIIVLLLVILLVYSIWKFNADKKATGSDNTLRNQESELFMEDELTAMNSDWRSFEDTKGGYRIKYPSTWMFESNKDSNEMIRADIAKGTIAGIQIRKIDYNYGDFSKYVDAYLENFKLEMSRHWQGEFSEQKAGIKIRNRSNHAEASFKFKSGSGEEWLFLEYIWQKDDFVIVFQGGIIYNEQHLYKPVIDRIVSSFEWIE